MLPSIWSENLFDDFFGDSFERRFFGDHNPLYGKHGKNLMKTDVKELDQSYEMDIDLPGFKRGDRTDIELPAVQREMIKALHDAGKKVIFVNCSGSPIAMKAETEHCQAILQAWYPGQSGG